MKKITTLAAILVIGFSFATKSDAATQKETYVSLPKAMPSLIAVSESRPPIGWVQFCAENTYECQVRASGYQKASYEEPMALDDQAWQELQMVNNKFNREIQPVTDQDHYGLEEKWTFANDGKGDCEDYVLEKRRELMNRGWPRSSLLITVVRDKKGDGHAVLTVRTSRGDFVLDNQEARVLHAQVTGYKFIKRQSEANQNIWVSLGEGQNAASTASR